MESHWVRASLHPIVDMCYFICVYFWILILVQHSEFPLGTISPPPLGLKAFLKFYFIYLFLAALGLRCCARAFSSRVERGLLFIVVASLVVEHGL